MADLHIHSNYSDGSATIEQILDYVEQETELSLIAITDHDTIDGALLASRIVRHGGYHFDVIIGEEITTAHGDVIGLFLDKRIEPGQSLENTLEEIKKQGGLAIVPHPNLSFINVQKRYLVDILQKYPNIISGIELSSFILFDSKAKRNWQAFTQVHHLAAIAATDSHDLFTIGRAQTLFAGSSADDLYNALKQYKTKAWFSPLSFSEKLQFFRGVLKKQLQGELRGRIHTLIHTFPSFSSLKLALHTAKRYFNLPY